MSAIDDLISGKTSPTQTPTSKSAISRLFSDSPQAPSGPTQMFNGKQIPANVSSKNLIDFDPKTGIKTFQLPVLGPDNKTVIPGGVYQEDAQGNILKGKHSNYGGVAPQTGFERDDKIPVSLGGVNSNAQNISMVPQDIAGKQDNAETNVGKSSLQSKAKISQILREKQDIASQPSFLQKVGSAIGDAATGVKQTVQRTPKNVKNYAVGLFKPDNAEKAQEANITNNPSDTVEKVATAPINFAEKAFSRIFTPGVRAYGENLGQIQATRERADQEIDAEPVRIGKHVFTNEEQAKYGLGQLQVADLANAQKLQEKVQKGDLPPEVMDDLNVLRKTVPQIFGDTAQAVLTGYTGKNILSFFENATDAEAGTAMQRLLSATKTATGVGTLFGAAGAASSGSKDPLEILQQIGEGAGGGALLGLATAAPAMLFSNLMAQIKSPQVRAILSEAAPKESNTLQDRVVQVVSPDGEKTYYTIPADQATDIINKIDNSGGIIPQNEQGNFHVTAKSPEQMEAQGFKNGGVADLNSIPAPKSNITDISPLQSKDTSTMLNAGFNPGVDKFIAEDVKPAIVKVKQSASIVSSMVMGVKNFLMDTFDIGKQVENKFGGSAYSDVIRSIHGPEADSLLFENQHSQTLDKNYDAAEKVFSKYPDSVLRDLNLTYGTPDTAAGQAAQTEAFNRLPDELKDGSIRNSIDTARKEIADFNLKFAKEHGIEITPVEDYVYGNYKGSETAKANFVDYWRTTEKYTKEKTFPTPADAAAYGLELKDQNPITNLKSEFTAISRRANMVELNNKLDAGIKNGSVTYAVTKAEATPDQFSAMKPIADPIFGDKLFDPKYADFVNSLLSTNKVSSNPLLKSIRNLNFALQTVKFTGSVFHQINEIKAAISSETGGLFNPKGWSDAATSFKGPDTSTPEYREYVNLGGGSRYSQEGTTIAQFRTALDKVGRGNYLGGVTSTAVGAFKGIGAYVDFLFNKYVPGMQFEKYGQDVALREQKLGRPLTDSEKIGVIRQNQNLYGEMNERLFGRSGTATSVMRLLFTAPGYGEGNFRLTGAAATGTLKVGAKVFSGDFAGAKESVNAGALKPAQTVINTLVTTAVMATLGTKLLTGKWPTAPTNARDVRDLFKVNTGVKDGNGDEAYIDMMSFDKDYWSIYGNAATGQFGNIAGDLVSRVSGGVSSTAKTVTDLASILEGKTVVDYKNTPIYYPTDSFPTKIQKLLAYEGAGTLPISVNTFQQSQKKGSSVVSSGLTALFGLRPTTSEEVKHLKAIRTSVFSLEDEKKAKQIELNTLTNENPQEAIKEAKAFNAAQTAKLKSILKGYKVNIPTTLFLINSLNPKEKNTGGTSIDSIFGTKK